MVLQALSIHGNNAVMTRRPVDILTILESSTKAIASIGTYSLYAPGPPLEALAVHRQAALAVIETLSALVQEKRM